MPDAPAVTVVIATRNRCAEVSATLERLLDLPERPAVIVVDNASSDATVETLRARFPAVTTIALERNIGAAARTVGARAASRPYVAFCDDDSWWQPGALTRATELLDGHPRLALVAARILVGPDELLDPTCTRMAASPLPTRPDLPGTPVLGFLACAAIVRREAFLAVGGFPELLLIGGEEAPVAWDLAAAGWDVTYAADVVAHHHPSAVRDAAGRDRLVRRNDALVAWMRRPLPVALGETRRLVGDALRRPALLAAVGGLLTRMPRALAARRRLPAGVESGLVLIARAEAGYGG
jgi:GT2 family glycosyltransferase